MIVASMEADIAANPSIEELPAGCKVSIPVNNLALPLKRVPYIYYLMRFKKDQIKVQALLDSDSKIIIMIPTYTAKLSLKVWPTDIKA